MCFFDFLSSKEGASFIAILLSPIFAVVISTRAQAYIRNYMYQTRDKHALYSAFSRTSQAYDH